MYFVSFIKKKREQEYWMNWKGEKWKEKLTRLFQLFKKVSHICICQWSKNCERKKSGLLNEPVFVFVDLPVEELVIGSLSAFLVLARGPTQPLWSSSLVEHKGARHLTEGYIPVGPPPPFLLLLLLPLLLLLHPCVVLATWLLWWFTLGYTRRRARLEAVWTSSRNKKIP